MRHGSLFSGIGGFDLAAEWMGWENIFHCEWNSFGQKILKYYWPKATSYGDITKTDFTIHRGTIDVLSGGFPCQPYSVAGKRKGKEDERHLWPEMLRAIREIHPRWVVGENVRGLVNWNGGLVFDEVQANLEAEGYEVLPFLLPACAVNAPHRRDRIWFIAHSCSQHSALSIQQRRQDETENINTNWENKSRDVADSNKINGDVSGFRAGEVPQQQATGIWEDNVADSDCKPWGNNKNNDDTCRKFRELYQKGLIPTPNARDYKSPNRVNSSSPYSMLNETIHKMILPTPRQSEWKGVGPLGSKSHEYRLKKGYLDATIQEQIGQTSQLNPRFVLEMMGFPPDWTELPFLNTETKV